MGYLVFLSFIYLDQMVVIPIELNKMYVLIAQKITIYRNKENI